MIKVTFYETQGQKSKSRRRRYTVIFKSPEMRFKFDMSILHQLLELTVSSRKIELEFESGFYASGL